MIMKNAYKQRTSPWLVALHPSVECEYVWGGYINIRAKDEPLIQAIILNIECQLHNLHSERVNYPPKMNPLSYRSQAFLKFSFVAQVNQKQLYVPASNPTSECSFSKIGHIFRARWTTLSGGYMKELKFLPQNQMMYSSQYKRMQGLGEYAIIL